MGRWQQFQGLPWYKQALTGALTVGVTITTGYFLVKGAVAGIKYVKQKIKPGSPEPDKTKEL